MTRTPHQSPRRRYDIPIQMRVNRPWLQRVDNWRKKQPELWNLTAAVRELVDRGLKVKVTRRT